MLSCSDISHTFCQTQKTTDKSYTTTHRRHTNCTDPPIQIIHNIYSHISTTPRERSIDPPSDCPVWRLLAQWRSHWSRRMSHLGINASATRICLIEEATAYSFTPSRQPNSLLHLDSLWFMTANGSNFDWVVDPESKLHSCQSIYTGCYDDWRNPSQRRSLLRPYGMLLFQATKALLNEESTA